LNGVETELIHTVVSRDNQVPNLLIQRENVLHWGQHQAAPVNRKGGRDYTNQGVKKSTVNISKSRTRYAESRSEVSSSHPSTVRSNAVSKVGERWDYV